MPNWCDNDLRVSYKLKQDKEEFERFKAFVKETKLDFEKIIPYPIEQLFEAKFKFQNMTEEEKKKVYGDTEEEKIHQLWFQDKGHSWCCTNWGTKWNISEPFVVAMTKSLKICFDTPWSPPIPIIKRLSEMFPNLLFKLDGYEQGVAYHYTCVYHEGIMIAEDEKEYHGSRGG